MSEPLTRYNFYYPGTHHGTYHADATMGEKADGEWMKSADVDAELTALRQQLADAQTRVRELEGQPKVEG